jgi:hypothetical protein
LLNPLGASSLTAGTRVALVGALVIGSTSRGSASTTSIGITAVVTRTASTASARTAAAPRGLIPLVAAIATATILARVAIRGTITVTTAATGTAATARVAIITITAAISTTVIIAVTIFVAVLVAVVIAFAVAVTIAVTIAGAAATTVSRATGIVVAAATTTTVAAVVPAVAITTAIPSTAGTEFFAPIYISMFSNNVVFGSRTGGVRGAVVAPGSWVMRIEKAIFTALGRAKIFARGGRARLAATSLLDAQRTTLDHLTGQAVLRLVSPITGGHLDEAEATAVLGVGIAHDVAGFDVTILLEERRELSLVDARMDACHEEIRALVPGRFVVVLELRYGGGGRTVEIKAKQVSGEGSEANGLATRLRRRGR